MPSVMNSIGIISNATIWNLKAKNARALAGNSIAKKGIMIVIYCEGTRDQIYCRMPAIITLRATLLAKDPVSMV